MLPTHPDPVRMGFRRHTTTAATLAEGSPRMTGPLSCRERISIAHSNFGRNAGWIVESTDGKQVAELCDRQWIDMFWDSYRIVPIDPVTLTAGFWTSSFTCRNRWFPQFTVEPFGQFDADTQRLRVRGLYIHTRLTALDRLLRFLRVVRPVEPQESNAASNC